MKSERERILLGLKSWGNRAYKELLANDIPVVVLRGNNICRISSFEKIEVIARVTQSKYRIRQRSIELSK